MTRSWQSKSVERTLSNLLLIVAVMLAAFPWLDWLDGAADYGAALLPVAPLAAMAAVLLAPLAGRWRWVVAIVAAAAATWLLVREVLTEPSPPLTTAPSMIVVIHNVSTKNRDPGGTISALLSTDADVLLLQESDGTLAPYLDRLRTRFPYGSRCRPECSIAIFSRWPTGRVHYGFQGLAGEQIDLPLVQTKIHLPGMDRPFPVVSLHLSRSESLRAQAKTRRALAAALLAHGPATMVTGGDFNLVPWSGAMRALDWTLLPMRRVTRGVLSWPAYLRGVDTPAVVPIDHLFAGPAWGVRAVRRLPRTGSDHYPIRVELVWQGK